jgi:hypothetical protein
LVAATGGFHRAIAGICEYGISMRTFLVLLALSVGFIRCAAADLGVSGPERETVLKTVQQFFDAMKAQDAAGIAAVWQPNTQFSVGKADKNGFAVSQPTIEQLSADLQKSKVGWLERMWKPTVHIEGRMAVIWARYDFYVGDKFSHNGTDCYTLLKTDRGWKIVGLAFTIEPGPTTENPSGPPK